MASNIENVTSYNNTTPAARLDKATLTKMAFRSCQLQSAFNFERMQSIGWLWGLMPGLQKIHTDKDDLSISMQHNLEFFNVHPFFVTFVMGIVLSLEQAKADISTIRSVRVALMGPLGGIGDSLFWFTLVPIAAGMTAGMAIDKSWAGPALYLLILLGVQMGLRVWLMTFSYNLGTNAISMLTSNAKEFTRSATILGIFVVGALVANFGGGTQLGILIPNGEAGVISLQAKFNEVLPGLLPLLLTLMCYWLLKKKNFTPVKCIVLLLVIGLVGCAFGIWNGDYTPAIPVPWTVGGIPAA